GHWPATITTQHVTIRHNAVENAQHAYGIAVREGSSDVHVEANYVQLEANFDWVYGIATDRGVHDITVFGNYVNAHTSGTFHTVGIHLSDFHVTDARRATGMVALRNTVANATAGGIISESSVGTIIGWNLVYMDYPGSKSVAVDYPRGIETEWFSNGTLVIGNMVHTFHWGIQVGSDQGVIASNTIYDVDYAIYVLDNAAWPGISSAAETIFDTTYSTVAIAPIRLPTGFQGTVVDLGPGIKKTDLTPVLFVTSPAATSVAVAWSGTSVNLSANVGGMIVFDTGTAADSQSLQASWTGPLASFDVTGLSAADVSFQLSSGVAAIHFRTDGGAWQSYAGPFAVAADGTHAVDYYSTDNTGNTETLHSVTVKLDTVAPVSSAQLAGTQAADGSYVSSVDVTLTSTDTTSGVQSSQYRVDAGAWRSYASAFPLSGNGTHTLEFSAMDVAGNVEGAKSSVVRISGP